MAKTLSNKKQRVELWLIPMKLKQVEKHLTKEGESRKSALERILDNGIDKELKSRHKGLFN